MLCASILQHPPLPQSLGFEAVDSGRGLYEGGLGVVPDVHGEPGAHGVVGGSPGALEVPGLERDLGYVRVVQRVPDLPEDLPRGGLEVQGVSPLNQPITSEGTSG
jgi:hypothetical protein